MLIGQIGNFAGMSQLQPPANVTMFLRCGQIGNRLCPEPWIGETAAVDPQGFRFPVWEFNWPGAYQMVDGKPMAHRAADHAGGGHDLAVSADLPPGFSRHRRARW